MELMSYINDTYFKNSLPYRHTMIEQRFLGATRNHAHHFYEVVLVFRGACVHYCNGHEYEMREGELSIVAPEVVHQVVYPYEGIHRLSMQVRMDEMERFLDAYGLREDEVLTEGVAAQLPQTELLSVSELCERVVLQKEEKRLQLYRVLLGEIFQGLAKSRLQGGMPEWLRMALEKMRSPRYAAEGVPALLRLCSVSYAQLCRVMKRYLDTTPQIFVRNLRLGIGYRMIENSDVKLSCVAEEVGYNSFSHFSTAFREQFGVTPSELRRQRLVRLALEAADSEEQVMKETRKVDK